MPPRLREERYSVTHDSLDPRFSARRRRHHRTWTDESAVPYGRRVVNSAAQTVSAQRGSRLVTDM